MPLKKFIKKLFSVFLPCLFYGYQNKTREDKMIVFISDLHFVDETAGKQNIPISAFEFFFIKHKKPIRKNQE